MNTLNISGDDIKFSKLVEKVNKTKKPTKIKSKIGNFVIMSLQEYKSYKETLYLLKSPKNASRLLKSIEEFEKA